MYKISVALAYIASAVLAQGCRDKYGNCSSLVKRAGCCVGKNTSAGPFNQVCCKSCKKVDSSAKCKEAARDDLTGREGLKKIKFDHKGPSHAVNGNHTCTKPEERKILD